MFMAKIEAPAVTCDLFAVTKGFDGNKGGAVDTGKGPRTANKAEARAYADFIRRKNNLPEIGAPALRNAGGRIWRGQGMHFHYVGATYGTEIGCGEYEPGAFSILFPGANQMRATVMLETLGDDGEAISSQIMPVEPKKGGVVWSRDDVRKACGPVAKVKAARKAPTVAKRRAAPTVDKRRRAIMLALRLRKQLRLSRDIAHDRLCQLAENARQNAAKRAAQSDAPAIALDSILSDLAEAEALMRGEGYVAPRPLSMREAFAALYRIARRDKLAGAALFGAACDLTGEPHSNFSPNAARLFLAVNAATQEAEPMRYKLGRLVLNCWGHGNPYRSPAMESPRFAAWQRTVRRADALRDRLKAAGRLELDAGNWVVRVLPLPVTLEPAPTLDEAAPTPTAIYEKRTPAHERAIRRAWAERKARRYAERGAAAFRDMAETTEAELQRVKAAHDRREAYAEDLREKLHNAECRLTSLTSWGKATQRELDAAKDQARLAEQEAADAMAAREDLKRILADAEARLAAAEAENAQLWAEIEGLTAPVPALAA